MSGAYLLLNAASYDGEILHADAYIGLYRPCGVQDVLGFISQSRLCYSYPATPYGWRTPHETNLLPPGEGPPTSTCFDDQLTRPLHANLLLQQETEGVHLQKIAGYYVNATVEHIGFRSQRWKAGETSISRQNAPGDQIAPNCVSNFKIFPG